MKSTDQQNRLHTSMGSLVTDVYSSTPVTAETAMGVVSDSGHVMAKPVTSWIFSIITAVGLLVFLFVSFFRYHRRLRDKREREEEFIRSLQELLPDRNYKDFKMTRARSVMTNTHFNTYPNIDNLEYRLGPPIGRRLFQTFPRFPSDTPEQHALADIHRYPSVHPGIASDQTNQTGKARSEHSLNFPYMDDDLGGVEFSPEDEMIHKLDSKNKNVGKYNKSKSKKRSKSKHKSSKALLRSKSGSFQDGRNDFIEISNNQSSYLSDFFLYTRQENYHALQESITKKRQTKSDSDLFAFASEESIPDRDWLKSFQNDYYLEAGLPRPRDYSRRRRSSSAQSVSTDSSKSSKKQNAFYDRLARREEPKPQYKELVHRDAGGMINFEARSLPCLDTEYHSNQINDISSQKLPVSTCVPSSDNMNSGGSSVQSSDPLLRQSDDFAKDKDHVMELDEREDETIALDASSGFDTSTDGISIHTTKL